MGTLRALVAHRSCDLLRPLAEDQVAGGGTSAGPDRAGANSDDFISVSVHVGCDDICDGRPREPSPTIATALPRGAVGRWEKRKTNYRDDICHTLPRPWGQFKSRPVTRSRKWTKSKHARVGAKAFGSASRPAPFTSSILRTWSDTRVPHDSALADVAAAYLTSARVTRGDLIHWV
jgi:hypothetical protein